MIIQATTRKKVLTNLTQLISQSKNIKVSFSGSKAYTNGNIINLPAMSEEAWLDDRLFVAAKAYAYHECGHVLYTDFNLLSKTLPQEKDLFNLFEDLRVERLISSTYAGARETLSSLVDSLFPSMKRDSIWSAVGIEGRRVLCGYSMPTPPDYKREIERIAPSLLDELRSMENSEDALRLAKKYLNVFSDPNPQDSDADSNDEESNECQNNEEGSDSDAAPSKNSDKSEEDKKGQDDNESEQEAQFPEYEEFIGELIGSATNDVDIIKEAVEILAERSAMGLDNREYLVKDTSHDEILICPEAPVEYFNQHKNELGVLSVHRQRIINLFRAKTAARWRQNRPQGKINTRKLASLRTGNLNVFREREISDEMDTAVVFLIDCSGSMAGQKIKMATQAAIFFLETLSGSNVQCEVLGFTTGGKTSGGSRELDQWGRLVNVQHYIMKSFAEPYSNAVKRRLGAIPTQLSLNANADVCAINWALSRLVARREKRKVLVVLSDGLPSAYGNKEIQRAELKRLCGEITQNSPIELIGVGVGTDAGRFYPNHINIHENDNIAQTIMVQIRKILGV